MEPALRHAVLAVAVLDDVDVIPVRHGVQLAGGAVMTWHDIGEVLGAWAAEPAHPVTRARLAALVHVSRLVAAGGAAAMTAVLRIHVEPANSALHAGAGWRVEQLGDGPVEAGWGIVGVPGATHTRPLPPVESLQALLRTSVAGGASWAWHRAAVDRLGGIAVARLERDRRAGKAVVIRPVGDADVATLLLSRTLRRWLADLDGTGLAALAVPTRSRGWSDVRRVDPAYVGAAWSATDDVDRAFGRPLLVTADTVSLPSGVGDVLRPALDGRLGQDPPRGRRWS